MSQFAIGLIISTLIMFAISYFYTDCHMPMIGNNPYATVEENATELSTNAEVYSLFPTELAALQLNSVFTRYKSKSFCEKLLSWVKSGSCVRVTVPPDSHFLSLPSDKQLCNTPSQDLHTPSIQKKMCSR